MIVIKYLIVRFRDYKGTLYGMDLNDFWSSVFFVL
jgi:hypothetical protein